MQSTQKEKNNPLNVEEYHGELSLLVALGCKILSDMYRFSKKSIIYNNAALSFYIQLFLLHNLGISQLSIMKWAESNLYFFACSKKPLMQVMLE